MGGAWGGLRSLHLRPRTHTSAARLLIVADVRHLVTDWLCLVSGASICKEFDSRSLCVLFPLHEHTQLCHHQGKKCILPPPPLKHPGMRAAVRIAAKNAAPTRSARRRKASKSQRPHTQICQLHNNYKITCKFVYMPIKGY